MPFQQNLNKYKRISAILITEGDGSIVTVTLLISLIRAALETIKPGEWVRIP